MYNFNMVLSIEGENISESWNINFTFLESMSKDQGQEDDCHFEDVVSSQQHSAREMGFLQRVPSPKLNT